MPHNREPIFLPNADGSFPHRVRETPDRIVANQSDAGIVWKTEVLAAVRGGAHVEAVAFPDEDSLRTEVSYVVGMLTGSKHREAAEAFFYGSCVHPKAKLLTPNSVLSGQATPNSSQD